MQIRDNVTSIFASAGSAKMNLTYSEAWSLTADDIESINRIIAKIEREIERQRKKS